MLEVSVDVHCTPRRHVPGAERSEGLRVTCVCLKLHRREAFVLRWIEC